MPSNPETVCVVVPLYRTALSATELAALERCASVLKKHPIAIVKPAGLDISPLSARFPQLRCESFRDDFFAGIDGYNRMLLSDEFYARFSNYRFMLVYQLDSFVFSDQLLDWCSRGYDYVGAPWLSKGKAPGSLRRLAVGCRRKFYRWFDVHNRHSKLTHDVQLRYSVGNGGFSLRRIAKMREVLAVLPERVEPYRLGSRTSWGEDLFFAIEANRYRQRVKIPAITEAVNFAWETNLPAAMQLSNGALPFGCHAWDKLHREEWRPVFESFGISLDTLLGK